MDIRHSKVLECSRYQIVFIDDKIKSRVTERIMSKLTCKPTNLMFRSKGTPMLA